MNKKPITAKIDNKYGKMAKTDETRAVKELFHMGYDIIQIHLITSGVMPEKIIQILSFDDVIKRCENMENPSLEFLYSATGLEFSE